MKRTIVILSGLIVLLALSFPALAAPATDSFLKLISLPNGFQPEGVVVGRGHTIYAGSLATGAIYQADLRTGQGAVVVPHQAGRIAVGLAFDERSNFLFAAGGPAGAGYAYDAATGASVGLYQFTMEPSFINDVVVTRKAAYFTDSFRPYLYRVPLGPDGQLPASTAVTAIPLGGDFVSAPGFNTNGIDATPDGKWLIIVQSATGKLYRVDPETGQATLIDLGGGTVPAGDGILLDGKTLYVVQNQLNQIAVIALDPELNQGQIVTYITDPFFDIPTTVAEFGNALYVVNARFGTTPTPDTWYEIVRVEKEQRN